MDKTPPLTSADRQGLLSRAMWVRQRLDQLIVVLRDQKEDLVPVSRKWIDDAFHTMFVFESSRPWLMFVRSIDHASRVARANPHFPDERRAEIARKYFSGDYADLEAKLDPTKVVAAIAAWRTKKNQWKTIHAAVLDFNPAAPKPSSLSRQWRAFPHLPEKTIYLRDLPEKSRRLYLLARKNPKT